MKTFIRCTDTQRQVERCEFFTAHDYATQKEALRIFWVKGKNKEARAVEFIKKALSEGLTVETGDRWGGFVKVIEIL